MPIPPAGSTRRFRTEVRYIGLSCDSSPTPIGVSKASVAISPRSSPCGESERLSRNSWGWLNSARSTCRMGATGTDFSFLSGASRYCSSRDVLALVEARGFLLCSKNPEARDRRFEARNRAFLKTRVFPLVEGARSLPSWAIVFLEVSRIPIYFLFLWEGGEGG